MLRFCLYFFYEHPSVEILVKSLPYSLYFFHDLVVSQAFRLETELSANLQYS